MVGKRMAGFLSVLTTADTGGCSCYQIATALGLGQPQFDFGCTKSNMLAWLGDRMLGLACAGGTCRVKFEAGTEVTLMARPDGAARFARWDGDCYGNQPITTVTVSRETACTAIFESSK